MSIHSCNTAIHTGTASFKKNILSSLYQQKTLTIKPSFMKQLTFNQCVVLLRASIVVLLLCLVTIFLFSVVSNNKSVESSDQQPNSGLQKGNVSYAASIQQTAIPKSICKNNDAVNSLLPSALSEQFMQ
jgi:hypothetical protein